MKSYSFFIENFNLLVRKCVVGVLIFFLVASITYAKPLSKVKKFLYPISFNFSIGGGLNSYRLMGENLVLFQYDGAYYFYSKHQEEQDGTAYLFRSLGEPYVRVQLFESNAFWDDLRNKPSTFLAQGIGPSIPITFSAYVDLWKKFRVELGSTVSVNFLKKIEPLKDYVANTPVYDDSVGRHYTIRLFFLPGFKLFENYAYTLLVNGQGGISFLYGDFIRDNSAQMRAYKPIAVGGGVTLEKHISEYLSLFGRILYENTTNSYIFEFDKKKSHLVLSVDGFYLQCGVSAHAAEMSRCPLPNCEITIKHKHADTAYRGSSWIKGRNSLGRRLYDK